MKRDDDVRIIRDEATVYAYLNRIRDGRTVSVSYLQHPWSAVCRARIAGLLDDQPAGGAS